MQFPHYFNLDDNYRKRVIQQSLNYIVKDGKLYDAETGEYIGDKFTAEWLRPVTSENNKAAYAAIKQLNNHTSDNGGFVFAFYKLNIKINEYFNSLHKSDIARLLFLATFAAYNDGRLKFDNGKCVQKKHFAKLIRLSEKRAQQLLVKFVDENILYVNEESELYINPSLFFRGELSKVKAITKDMQYTRLFKKTVRELFHDTNSREIARLSLIYMVLPYLHMQTNIICKNPLESDIDKIQPMTLDELSVILEYESYSKLKIALNNVKIGNVPVFGFFENPYDRRKKRITLNPNIVFSGNGTHLDALKALFNQ